MKAIQVLNTNFGRLVLIRDDNNGEWEEVHANLQNLEPFDNICQKVYAFIVKAYGNSVSILSLRLFFSFVFRTFFI